MHRVFHDLSEIFARTADELLPPPVFPTFDLSIPVDQLPPSLPFTDPVIPDMHPTPYLFALHRLSLQRSNELLAIRLFHLHQVTVARKLYAAEVERIEDEYEGATKGVVERLLEGVEERRRRLHEEKDGEGISLGAFSLAPFFFLDSAFRASTNGANLPFLPHRYIPRLPITPSRNPPTPRRTQPSALLPCRQRRRSRLHFLPPPKRPTNRNFPPLSRARRRPLQPRRDAPPLRQFRRNFRSSPFRPRGRFGSLRRLEPRWNERRRRGRKQEEAWGSEDAAWLAAGAFCGDQWDVQFVWEELEWVECAPGGGDRWRFGGV